MDIRKYFSAVSSSSSSKKSDSKKTPENKSSKSRKRSKDEDEDPIPKKSKKKNIIESDESEEDPLPRKKAKQEVVLIDSDDDISPKKSKSAVKSKSIENKSKPLTKKVEEPPLKAVDASNFFGSSPIHRSNKGSVVAKRKTQPTETEVGKQNTDELHDDEDFQKTLRQLDEQESSQKNKKAKVESPIKVETHKHNGSDKGSGTLSGKLAEKAKSHVSSKTELPDRSKLPVSPKNENKSHKISPEKQKTDKISPQKQKTASNDQKPEKISPAKGKVDKISPPKQKTVSSKKSKSKLYTLEMEKPDKTPKRKDAEKNTPDKDVISPSPLAKKKSNSGAAFYRSFMEREGPKALGSKEIPEGEDSCLEGLTIVISGVLESIERDEAAEMVVKYGGKVTQSVSKKTSYIVVGRDPGKSKLEKAEKVGTPKLDEDGFLELIRTRPGKGKKTPAKSTPAKKEADKIPEFTQKESPKAGGSKSTFVPPRQIKESFSKPGPSMSKQAPSRPTIAPTDGDCLMWVDKYKPANTKQIIGQQGDKSNVKKLTNWLHNWHKNVAAGRKPTFGKWGGGSDDGGGYRAALLSGPPGVGKTTTAQLVCQEVGITYVEMNASDTRSKRNLQQVVAELLSNQTLSTYATGQNTMSSKHCLLMDEVDGMAGNEDRGGVQELIQLIKQTKVPIICMCNDRAHPKIRSLVNYCFDLRFQRPRVDQIKGALLSICYKEGLTLSPLAVQEIIMGANQDIRQALHHLSMWSADDKNISQENVKKEANKAKKDTKLSPFEALRKVFNKDEHKTMSIHDKSDLFFYDYSIAPLFVHENYPHVQPLSAQGNRKKLLDLMSQTADSLCDGDHVERMIRSDMSWSLLPLQAMFSSVIPGELMSGYMSGMINFPQWLGKNSTRGKMDRMLQELHRHTRLRISANKTEMNMDYLQAIHSSITQPLVDNEGEGVSEAVAAINNYDLLREDLESLTELTSWPGKVDPMTKVNPKVKASFTRAYNKDPHLNPYSVNTVAKKGRARGSTGEGVEMEGESGDDLDDDDNQDEEKIENDAMIKAKKPSTASSKGKGKSSNAEEGSSNKGKGRGKNSKSSNSQEDISKSKGGGGRGRGRGKAS